MGNRRGSWGDELSVATHRAAPASPEAQTAALYEQYSSQIERYCLGQLRSREDAEDAVQNVYLRVYAALRKGVVPEFEAAWLYKIAHNVCLSKHAGSARRSRIESPHDLQMLEERVAAPDSEQARVELAGLDDALASMPENLRRAILLREWQGLSYAEIADELGLSQSAVETLIFRARRYLAKALDSSVKQPARRIASALNLGPIVAAIRSWLAGAGAVKLGAGAVVVAAGLAGGGVAVSESLGGSQSEPVQRFQPPVVASVSQEPPVEKVRPVRKAKAKPVRAQPAKPTPLQIALRRGSRQQQPVQAPKRHRHARPLAKPQHGSSSIAQAPASQQAGSQAQAAAVRSSTEQQATQVGSPPASQPAQAQPSKTRATAPSSATAAAGGAGNGTAQKPAGPKSRQGTKAPTPPPIDTNPTDLTPPTVTLPKVKVPKVKLPKVKLPKAKLPKAKLPKAKLPKAKLPKAKLPKAKVPKATVPAPSVPTATAPAVPEPTVPPVTTPTVPTVTLPTVPEPPPLPPPPLPPPPEPPPLPPPPLPPPPLPPPPLP